MTPSSPPKIKTVRIIDNPFDDIVPRITAEEKRAQQRARAEAMKEREDVERRKGAKKCVLALFLPSLLQAQFDNIMLDIETKSCLVSEQTKTWI